MISIAAPPDGPSGDRDGFIQPPFTLAPDPRFLYRSESHAHAIRVLLQSIARHDGLSILTGAAGTGKTTTCAALRDQLDTNTFTSAVRAPSAEFEGLMQQVLLDFGVVSPQTVRSGRLAGATRLQLIVTLHDFLLSLTSIRGRAVLIVDDAHRLPPDVIESIRVLANFEGGEGKLLHIMLVGEPDLLQMLGDSGGKQVGSRVPVRATLDPLSGAEIEAYIDHRLSVAGRAASVTLAPGAVDAIQRFTGGVPGRINVICARALMFAARQNPTRITPDIVAKAGAALARSERRRPSGSRRRAMAWGAPAAVTAAIAKLRSLVNRDS